MAIRGVNVVDVTDGAIHSAQTVLITGNRIVAVGPTDEVLIPGHAEVVEAAGGYLIPGLWDMHVHIFDQFNRRPPNTWYFPLFTANGVTSVRDLWTKPENMGQVREWRRLHEEGRLLAPRIAAVGTIVDGPAGAEARDMDLLTLGPTVNVVETPEEARRFVRELKAAGIDFVKTYSNLQRETYFAIAKEASNQGISFAGHVPFAVDAAEASSAGQQSMEHMFQILESSSSRSQELFQVSGRDWSTEHNKILLDTFDERRFRTLVTVLAKNRTRQVPTLVMGSAFAFRQDPRRIQNERRLRYIPADEISVWNKTFASEVLQPIDAERTIGGRLRQKRLEVLRRMHEAGVPFMAGSDVGNPYVFPGFSLHDELSLLVEAGLTPIQALQTATRNPAEFLGLLDSLGTVEQGKIADLVLLDANPLKDIGNTRRIRAVVANGRLYRRADLDRLLAEVEAFIRQDERHPPVEGAVSGAISRPGRKYAVGVGGASGERERRVHRQHRHHELHEGLGDHTPAVGRVVRRHVPNDGDVRLRRRRVESGRVSGDDGPEASTTGATNPRWTISTITWASTGSVRSPEAARFR